MKPIPKFVLRDESSREFKARKRAQLKAARKAIERLRYGCAVFPGGTKLLNEADLAMRQLEGQLSVKNWGR